MSQKFKWVPKYQVADKHRISKTVLAATLGITVNMLTKRYINEEAIEPDEDGKFGIGDIMRIMHYEAVGAEIAELAKHKVPTDPVVAASMEKDRAIAYRQHEEGNLAAMQFARFRGELLPQHVVIKYLGAAMTTLRSRLLRLPANLSQLIPGDEKERLVWQDEAATELARELDETARLLEELPQRVIAESQERVKSAK